MGFSVLWVQAPDFSDTNVTEIDANTTSNKIFYAKWNIETYDVTFNLNGEMGITPDTQQIIYNNKATKPTDPTTSGKVFKYWYKYISGDPSEEDTPFNFDTLITENTTLYAK